MRNATAGELNRLTSLVIAAAIEVHRRLGPGLFEEAYLRCLVHELLLAGLNVVTERYIAIQYKELRIDRAYRVDIEVNGSVLVEIKAVELVTGLHLRQMKTYLTLGDYRVGLLLNFGAQIMKEGIRRMVNNFPKA